VLIRYAAPMIKVYGGAVHTIILVAFQINVVLPQKFVARGNVVGISVNQMESVLMEQKEVQ